MSTRPVVVVVVVVVAAAAALHVSVVYQGEQ